METHFKEYSDTEANKLLAAISKAHEDEHKEQEEEKQEEKPVTVTMSTEASDRDGEVIKFEAWDFKNFKKNPVILWGHNFLSPPIAKAVSVNPDPKTKSVKVDVIFASTPFAQEIKTLVDEGMVNAVSPGFLVREREGQTITKAELLEVSFVPIPANPEALVTLEKAVKSIENLIPKGVVPPHEPPPADKELEWDATEAVKRLRELYSEGGTGEKDDMDWAAYKQAFGWFDGSDVENFASYKLPHHDVIDGKLVTHWRGTVAAMGALLGARGGADIPDGDREGVYNHLAKHYRQFDEEPPEFSSYTPEDLKALFPEFHEEATETEEKSVHEVEEKAGRVLSAKNRTKIKNTVTALNSAVKALEELLQLSEKPKVDLEKEGEKATVAAQGIQKLLEEVLHRTKRIAKGSEQ